jgi:hypothetical protein
MEAFRTPANSNAEANPLKFQMMRNSMRTDGCTGGPQGVKLISRYVKKRLIFELDQVWR